MIEALLQGLRTEAFGGVLAGSLVVSILFTLKALPGELWSFVKWRFTCSLTIFNEDAAFERVSEWLSGLEYTKRCRRLRLTTTYDHGSDESSLDLSPGFGAHFFWYRGRPILVRRALPDKTAGATYKRFEDIIIETLGASPETLKDLVQEIKDARRKQGPTIDVYLFRGRWRVACRKPKRSIDSVVLPEAQKAALVRDVREFIDSRDWYTEHGVPYRRGYLFEGPPGNGKTSLALALASHFSRPVYALNLGSIANDDQLIEAVADVPEHGVLLLEDIDAAKASAARATEPVALVPGQPQPNEKREISLSALLNVIDGVFSRDGRILIMTTNHPEKVDPALIRPGRADRREVIGPLGAKEIKVMCDRFFGSPYQAHMFANSVRAPISAAELQERLVQETRGRKMEAA
jgi:hypothetical protein